MWIIAADGFFSIVEAPEDKTKVVVRGRVRGDLVALRRFVPTLGRISETRDRDYAYRCVVSKTALATGIAKVVMESVTYKNFKNAVGQRDPIRATLLARVWATLYELQMPAPQRLPKL